MMIFEMHNVSIDELTDRIGRFMGIKYRLDKSKNLIMLLPDLIGFGNDEYHVQAFHYTSDIVIMEVYSYKFIEDKFFYNVEVAADYIHNYNNLSEVIALFRTWINNLNPVLGLVTPYGYPIPGLTIIEDNVLFQKIREDPCKSIAIMYITDEPSIISTKIINLLKEPPPSILEDPLILINDLKHPKTSKNLLDELSNRCRVEVMDRFAIIYGPRNNGGVDA